MAATTQAEALIARPTPRAQSFVTAVLRRALADKRARFVLIGAVNTAFGFVSFVGYQYLIGRHSGYMWSLFLTHLTSVLFAFMTHRTFVFQVKGNVLRDLARFESVYLTSLGTNAVLLPAAVELAHMPVLVGQALITATGVVTSWLGHSRFSFRRKGVAVQ